eukprot:GHRR01032103.1.p2 GENE.GHRR01032103.1~~GHRR01032103.1.p2  ORF type:complete len:107 (+),score=21.07 GHRR01032103.1:158-478(+)
MDMWGVGCVMFEIVALYPLFPGNSSSEQPLSSAMHGLHIKAACHGPIKGLIAVLIWCRFSINRKASIQQVPSLKQMALKLFYPMMCLQANMAILYMWGQCVVASQK